MKGLIDCGRGTVIRMSQAGFSLGCTDTVILSLAIPIGILASLIY